MLPGETTFTNLYFQNFIWVFAYSLKNGIPLNQKTFMVESCFQNGQKVNDVWVYSIQAAWEESREELPNNIIKYGQQT